MSPVLEIKLRHRHPHTILDLNGDIIGSWALNLKGKLYEIGSQDIPSVILNFRDVASIDGLGVMVIGEALVGGLIIYGLYVSSLCQDMFQRHGITFVCFSEERQAIEALQAKPRNFPDRRQSPRTKTRIAIEFTIPSGTYRGVFLDLSKGGALMGYLDPIQDSELMTSPLTLNVECNPMGQVRLAGKAVGRREDVEMPAVGLRLSRTPFSFSPADPPPLAAQ